MTLPAALNLAALGLRVMPCAVRGKHPLTPHGLTDASADPEQIASWWTTWPTANVGIVCGAVSGVVGLDVDVSDEKRGDRSLVELVMRHGALPETWEAITGSGGSHLYFQHPGWRVPPSTSKLGPGLDVRGDGSYLVAPPSMHACGERYTWERPPTLDTLAPLPPWLAEMLRPAPPPTVVAPPLRPYRLTMSGHEALDVLARECAFVEHAASDAASLTYDEWFSLATILHVFPLGDVLFEELSALDPRRHRPGGALAKARTVHGRPRLCTNLGGFSCPKLSQCSAIGVRSPAGLPYKLKRTA